MFKLKIESIRWQIMLLAIVSLLMVNIGGLPAWGSKPEEEILSAARSYVKTELTVTADWRPTLSKRWRDAISDETVAALIATYKDSQQSHPFEYSLKKINVTKFDANTAVVEYQLNGNANTMHMYLVKEDGKWFADSLLGHTPGWAVPSENKKLYDDILEQLNEFYSLQFSDDISKKKTFMNKHFSSEALAEQDPVNLMTQRDYTGRILSPISLIVYPAQKIDGAKVVGVSVARIQGDRKGTDNEMVHLRRTGYWFVEQGGQWKFLMQHMLSPEEVIARFLELWQQGETEMMSRLLSSDAGIYIAGDVKKAWSDVKNGLPKVHAPEDAIKGMLTAKNGSVTLDLSFPDGSAWSSGSYQFNIEMAKRYGLPCYRISKIRFLDGDKEIIPLKQ